MKQKSSGFSFPLPFDPFRLLLAALENAIWVILAAALFGGLAAAFGWYQLGSTYKAPVILLKESAPDNWQDNPSGPYSPRPLGAEALKIVAYSDEVFGRAGAALTPPAGATEMRAKVFFEEVTGQDLFEARGFSKSSAEEALANGRAYADAIIAVVTERRREEAASAAALYGMHLEQKREAAAGVSKKLLEASSEGGVFDTEGQTSNRLTELTALRAKRQEAAGAVENARAAVSAYLGQSWIAPLRAELERLKRTAGPASAAVAAREAELADVEDALAALTAVDGGATVRAMAAKLPAVVYRELLRLREELKAEQVKLDAADALIAEAEEKLKELPDQVLTVSDLQANLKEKLASSIVIETRMKEAEFYAETPPLPVQLLQEPTIADVDHRSALSKSLLLGAAGTVLGALLALGAVLLFEPFRRTVRTPLQAAIATSAVPKLNYPRASRARGKAELRDFWLRSVGRFLPDERRFLFPVLGDAKGEEAFWEDLFGVLDGGHYQVVFMDFGDRPIKAPSGAAASALPDYEAGRRQPVSAIDPSRFSAEQIGKICAELPERHILLVRWAREPDTALVELCGHIDRCYFITSGRDAKTAEVEYQSGIYRDLLGEAEGVVLAERRRPGRARRVVAALEEWFIESRGRAAANTGAAPGWEGAAL